MIVPTALGTTRRLVHAHFADLSQARNFSTEFHLSLEIGRIFPLLCVLYVEMRVDLRRSKSQWSHPRGLPNAARLTFCFISAGTDTPPPIATVARLRETAPQEELYRANTKNLQHLQRFKWPFWYAIQLHIYGTELHT